jgi:hypothetical protein
MAGGGRAKISTGIASITAFGDVGFNFECSSFSIVISKQRFLLLPAYR